LAPGARADRRLTWSAASPGFYAARDNRNLNPADYALVGGHQSFYWDDLEPTEGGYAWSKWTISSPRWPPPQARGHRHRHL
jgi:hypothetical protein